MIIVTRIAAGYKNDSAELAKAVDLSGRLGVLRSDIWNKLGGFQAWGGKCYDLAKVVKSTFKPESYQIDFKCWDKTTCQVINDILMTHAAIKEDVIKKIYARYPAADDRKQLCSMLNTIEYKNHNVLHRWVRNASGRGHTDVDNQIVICNKNGAAITRDGRVTTVVFNGKPVEGKSKRYEKITLRFLTGKVDITGFATIIFRDGGVFLHYPFKKELKNTLSDSKIGIDKGYTEAFYGSDGIVYGDGIGKIMTKYEKWLTKKMKGRNQLHAQYKKTGNKNILKNNLSRKVIDARTTKIHAQLDSIINNASNVIFQNYGTVVCEDLSGKIKSKRKTHNRLNQWCKGRLQDSLEAKAAEYQGVLKIINPAYTSQVDSTTGCLTGVRNGDRFITHSGDVIHADHNAAINILARDNDRDITRYMRAEQVKAILSKRTASFLRKSGKECCPNAGNG